MKKLLIVLVSLAATSALAQDCPKYMNVLAVNGLNMRSKPESNARIVTNVAFGKQVEILERTEMQLKLGWINDHWYRVRYRGREGFIYGGYLSELRAPEKQPAKKLSDLLPLYGTLAFETEGSVIESKEGLGSDTVNIQIVKFTNGAELELELGKDGSKAVLILPASVQEAYVLVEALLKTHGMASLLDSLRFIHGRDGILTRVNNANGSILIRPIDNGMTSITFTHQMAME
ncbi:MAG: hypothetical protein RL266_1663 [Bacteroidota bacterium]|jgi:hypothetical protein